MTREREVRALAECHDRLLEPLVLEGDHATAVLADDVVVMFAAGIDALISRGLAAQVDLLDQAEALELLERAVDGRPSHAPQAPVDLESRQRARLPAEQLDDLLPATPASEPGRRQCRLRALGPGVRRWPHQAVSASGLPGIASRCRRPPRSRSPRRSGWRTLMIASWKMPMFDGVAGITAVTSS